MTSYQYRDYTGVAVGHTEVISTTVDETIAAIYARRAADFSNYRHETVTDEIRNAHLAEFRAFSAEMNTRTSW